MPQTFDFQTAKITTKRVGKPVHVAKALLDIRDESGMSNETREVLKHAVDYIRALERAVSGMAVSSKARRTGTVPDRDQPARYPRRHSRADGRCKETHHGWSARCRLITHWSTSVVELLWRTTR